LSKVLSRSKEPKEILVGKSVGEQRAGFISDAGIEAVWLARDPGLGVQIEA